MTENLAVEPVLHTFQAADIDKCVRPLQNRLKIVSAVNQLRLHVLLPAIGPAVLSRNTRHIPEVGVALLHLPEVVRIEQVCPVGAPENQCQRLLVGFFKKLLDHPAERGNSGPRCEEEIVIVTRILGKKKTLAAWPEIGRASCRERGAISGVAVCAAEKAQEVVTG